MERFVFVAAITFAIIFAVVALVGRGHFRVEVGEHGRADLVSVEAGRTEAQSFAGDELELRNIAAHVVITPEERSDFSVEIDNPGHAPMPQVSIVRGDVRIDGRVRGRVKDCRDDGGVSLDGYGEFSLDQLPQVTIHAPRTLHLSFRGGGLAEVGATQALELDLLGCGAVRAGDVADTLDVDVAGSGAVRAGAARSLSADILGSGDLTAGAIAEGANLDVAGSGSVTIASLTGDLTADGVGSGDVVVNAGQVAQAKVDIAGSGNVRIVAPVASLRASIIGSGDVEIAGSVGDLYADIAGPGSIAAQAVTGTLTKQVVGSGEVRIGE